MKRDLEVRINQTGTWIKFDKSNEHSYPAWGSRVLIYRPKAAGGRPEFRKFQTVGYPVLMEDAKVQDFKTSFDYEEIWWTECKTPNL